MLNRSAIVVRPAKPFDDWALGLDDSGMIPSDGYEPNVYLVPDIEDAEERQAVLNLMYPIIFDSELNGWHTDESAWPAPRTLAMFMQWFTVEIHEIVHDLCSYESLDDDV